MKLKSILLAGAVAALPFAAAAQDPNPPNPPQRQKTQQTTTMTDENGDTKIVTMTGTVRTFDAGHSITIVNDKGEAMTYTLTESTDVPKNIEVGKTVTIQTTTVSGSPVVKTITTTTTKETKKRSY